MKAKITTVAVVAAGTLLATAGAASAATHPATRAQTKITNRPDGGNGGTWAYDSMTRSITIKLTGGTAGAYTFTAKLKDKGSFTTIKGAKTPNQGGSYAGDTIKSKVTGKMTGHADFSFTASSLPSTTLNAGVPLTENDHGNAPAPANSTSAWYKLAFPSGTTFGGAGIGAWSWTYKATVVTTTSHRVCLTRGWCWRVPVVHVSHQKWVDAYNNGDGNLPGDGNVTG